MGRKESKLTKTKFRCVDPLAKSALAFNPLYTDGFFLLVWYNKPGIVYCTYLGVSGYIVFMPSKGLWEAYSNRTVRPSVPLRVRCISPIFFEVVIPNLVCGCIMGWQSVAYHFRVTVTLTSDLVFMVITMSVRLYIRPSRFMSGVYLLYSLR